MNPALPGTQRPSAGACYHYPMPRPHPALLPVALSALLGTLPGARAATPDLVQAATRTAAAVNGVLRNCPTSFARVGTAGKQCVGAPGTTEQVRLQIGAALGGDLYGVWRSRDDQRSVYNWLRTPGGFAYLRLQPDPDGRARTLVYLDTPPDPLPAAPALTLTPVQPTTSRPAPTAAPAAPAPASTTPASTAPTSTAPTAPAAPAAPSASRSFRRTLEVQTPRLNGEDVRAVQNRLIRLTLPARPGQGDGWFGPVTAATVRAFQAANRLPVTGRVDRATWDRLFAPDAATFTPAP